MRAYPASRRHPQFGRDALERSLASAGICYVWEGKALGGRRRLAPESRHTALRNSSFRAYADHMMTRESREGFDRLLGIAGGSRTAIMCAERLPWECHRNLVADCLVALHGVAVMHLGVRSEPQPHRVSAAARVAGDAVIYDTGAQGRLELRAAGTERVL